MDQLDFDNEDDQERSIALDDFGASLPDGEELKTELVRTQRGRSDKYKIYCAVAGCLLVLIFGLSVGIAGQKSTGSSHSNVGLETAGPEATVPESPLLPIGFSGQGDPARYTAALKFLSALKLSASTAMSKEGTAQNSALNWVANNDEGIDMLPQNMSSPGALSFVQRYLLATMYWSLDGSKWSSRANFLSSANECDWNRGMKVDGTSYKFGVSCDENGKVSRIFMPSNNWAGSLPDEIGFLRSMTHLSLYDNAITGSLPMALDYLDDLEFLGIEDNQLTGYVPDFLKHCGKLKSLALGNNRLKGPLPKSMFKLTSLTELSLEGNSLTGSIDMVTGLPNLERLYLGRNQFEGKLDDTFLAGSKILDLDLGDNLFTGYVPSHFFDDNTIRILDIHDNKIAGPLPDIMSSNTAIQYFSAFYNHLDATIPTTISNLKHLTHMDLSNNRIQGRIPTSLNEMTKLQYLFLAYNQFTESPFPAIDSLTALKELSLKETHITGTFPTEIGMLTDLVLLDLGRNNIRGSIPHHIGSLSSLSFLILNHNQLTGTLTIGFRKLNNIEMILVDNNHIKGGADRVCGAEGPKPGPSVFAADSPGKFECGCCTLNCTGQQVCYEDINLLAKFDLDWGRDTYSLQSDYVRDSYIFSENMVFQTKRGTLDSN